MSATARRFPGEFYSKKLPDLARERLARRVAGITGASIRTVRMALAGEPVTSVVEYAVACALRELGQ